MKTNRYMRKCSMSPVIREMPMETTMGDYLKPVKRAIFQKKKNRRQQGGEAVETFRHAHSASGNAE